MRRKILSSVTVFFVIAIGKLFISSSPINAENTGDSNTDKYQEQLQFVIEDDEYRSYALNLPKKMEFAGNAVPLEEFDVLERLDRELHVNTYWQSNTLLMIKKANRYFPTIRPILKKNGIPDDFKYLPLVESSFNYTISPAGAEGFWQFMEPTGIQYGLEISREIDERYHLEKATEAACRYLKYAYSIFNDWALVAASYNMGITGVKLSLEKQQVNSYYDLRLNEQTARYVFRMLSIKEIMEHPKKYGFHYKKQHLYQTIPVSKIRVAQPVQDLVAWSRQNGINYKILKEFNPWLKTSTLAALKDGKTYYIDLPKNRKPELFMDQKDSLISEIILPESSAEKISEKDSFKAVKTNAAAEDNVEEMQPVLYTVKRGDNLGRISKKYKVETWRIMKWNKLENTKIKRGQELLIYQNQLEEAHK